MGPTHSIDHNAASNTRYFCAEHSAAEPQYMETGGRKYRKVGFPVEGQLPLTHEWMWVQVDREDALEGILDNDPSFATYVQHGDRILFSRQEDGRMRFADAYRADPSRDAWG